MAEVIATVARELNRVKSVGAARAVAGAALSYAGTEVYPALDRADLPRDMKSSLRRSLDAARVNVENGYKALPEVSTWALDAAAWSKLRRAIEKLYIESSGVFGAADYKPRSTFADALAKPLRNVTAAVGKAAADVANVAGQAAGSAIGGAAGGLGLWGLLVVAAGVLLFLRAKGTASL